MPREQVTIEGKSTSGTWDEAAPRVCILKYYLGKDGKGDGWEVHFGIGKPDSAQMDKAMRLRPDEADDLAEALQDLAQKARGAYVAAHTK